MLAARIPLQPLLLSRTPHLQEYPGTRQEKPQQKSGVTPSEGKPEDRVIVCEGAEGSEQGKLGEGQRGSEWPSLSPALRETPSDLATRASG